MAGLCGETDPEYELRFAADEEYVRELTDPIDEMSHRGVKLCNRCTEKHPGKGQVETRQGRRARTAIGMLSEILFCRRLRRWRGGRAVASGKANEISSGDGAQRWRSCCSGWWAKAQHSPDEPA